MLRTRPDIPQPNLPALYQLRYGAYLYVNPRFCLRLPSGTYSFQYPCPRLSFGSVSLDMDFAVYLCQNTSASPFSSRTSPAHIGIGSSLATTPSHTTQHTGPYNAVRLIQGRNQFQGNTSPSDEKYLLGSAY